MNLRNYHLIKEIKRDSNERKILLIIIIHSMRIADSKRMDQGWTAWVYRDIVNGKTCQTMEIKSTMMICPYQHLFTKLRVSYKLTKWEVKIKAEIILIKIAKVFRATASGRRSIRITILVRKSQNIHQNTKKRIIIIKKEIWKINIKEMIPTIIIINKAIIN